MGRSATCTPRSPTCPACQPLPACVPRPQAARYARAGGPSCWQRTQPAGVGPRLGIIGQANLTPPYTEPHPCAGARGDRLLRPTTAMASRCSCSTAAAAARCRRSTSKTTPATWATACSGCSRCGPQHVFSPGDGCWHSVESRAPQHAHLAWQFHCPSLSELKRVTGNELLETKRVCLRSASADAPRGPGPCVLNRTKTLIG